MIQGSESRPACVHFQQAASRGLIIQVLYKADSALVEPV